MPLAGAGALPFCPVVTSPPAQVPLAPVGGEARPIEDWVTTFHLVVVAVDPFTHESGWLLDTAGRILEAFTGADCRVAWLVAGNDDQARQFLGPWGERLLAFADPERELIKALGLERLPALVHIDHELRVVGSAEGWNPGEWRRVADELASVMSWTRPAIPGPKDPTPVPGNPCPRVTAGARGRR